MSVNDSINWLVVSARKSINQILNRYKPHTRQDSVWLIKCCFSFFVSQYPSRCYGGIADQGSPVDHSQLWYWQTGGHANEWVLVERNPALCGAVQLPTPTGGRACVWGAAPVEYHFSGIWFQNRLWHQVGLIMRQAAGWPVLSVLRVCAGYAVTMVSKCILPWLYSKQ